MPATEVPKQHAEQRIQAAVQDPDEALSTRPEEGTDPGVVVETVEKGYRLNGQVLRPARVVVSA